MTSPLSQRPLQMTSRSQALPLLLLVSGVATVALTIIQPLHEKIAIMGSAFGLLSILVGVHLLNERPSSSALTLSMPWLRYLPLVMGISVDLLAGLVPPAISAFALAVALTLFFPLSKASNVSKAYIVFLTVFLAGSIAYNVFNYYALVRGADPMGYLSVASAIAQRGHYSGVIQPTDAYYFPFPVMSIATSILSSVTGFTLPLSLLIFPGSMILLQPLLVFVLSRLVFDNAEAAALSAFIVVTESAVTQWITSPIAQSTAISMLLVVLIALFGRFRSRSRTVVALITFLILVALHGAVGLVSIVLVSYLMVFERSSYRGILRPMLAIFIGYLMVSAVVDVMFSRMKWNLERFLEFIFMPASRVGSEVYGTGSIGLIFVWWGLPVSLAVFSVLVQRRKQASPWVYAGLGFLGLSFAANIVAPTLDIDRYGGLAAWLILAVAGGKAVRALTRTSRQMLMFIPILLLVSSSAVIDPSLSPQYGYQGYQDVLPTTNADRVALDWVNHYVIKNIFGDPNSAFYLIFSRYQSGVLSDLSVQVLSSDITNPWPNHVLFVRGSILASALANQHGNPILNVLCNNGFDVLEANPAWM